LARRGWAGEKSGCFSILLVELGSAEVQVAIQDHFHPGALVQDRIRAALQQN